MVQLRDSNTVVNVRLIELIEEGEEGTTILLASGLRIVTSEDFGSFVKRIKLEGRR
jgi:uncharacterized protein YlzI (FlbEa/FlbD family)